MALTLSRSLTLSIESHSLMTLDQLAVVLIIYEAVSPQLRQIVTVASSHCHKDGGMDTYTFYRNYFRTFSL